MGRSTSDLLSRHYGLVAKDLLTPVLDVFGAARSTFDGDIEKAIVLLEVVVRTLQNQGFAEADLPTLLSGGAYPKVSTNMRSISDSSGIPKETVRRKVAGLVEDGLILRDGNELSLSPAAAPALTPIRNAVLKLAMRNYESIAGLKRRDN